MIAAAAVLLAWALDAAFGEPRSAWHPVAWFGRSMAPLGQRLTALGPRLAFAAGAAAWIAAVGAAALAAWALQGWIATLPPWLAVPLLALALKPAFAWRMLKDEVRAVEAALGESLDAGRRQLSRLCSRDVAPLDAAAVRETAIESLAENFNDSLVAPLFWFVIAGLPGAWVWRAANTLDAMWGYRGRWEWAGKCAARADDALAWAPARIAAALLWRPSIGWAALRREARRTPSPNGGWPMAALALRLGVRLGKPGVYVLNAAAPAPGGAAPALALRTAERAARAAFLLAAAVLLLTPIINA
ncbi:MAG: adenosylcobinamide-phosphate synthase CbiB [Rubrivivax sp.]